MEQVLRYVYQVYLDRNFTKAAEHMNICQPTMSLAIKKLESFIGAPLFDRSSRNLELTEIGQAYIRFIKKSMLIEDDLEAETSDIIEGEKGVVRIGGTHYINSYVISDVLTSFFKSHPNVEIKLEETGSEKLSQMFYDGMIDVMFSCNQNLVENNRHYHVFDDYILIAANDDVLPNDDRLLEYALTASDIINGKHKCPDCPKISIESFKSLPFIILSEGNNLRQRCFNMFAEKNIKPNIALELSQLATAYSLAAHGFAATFISDRLVKNTPSKLRFFMLDSDETRRSFHIIFSDSRYISHAVKAFIDEIRASLV